MPFNTDVCVLPCDMILDLASVRLRENDLGVVKPFVSIACSMELSNALSRLSDVN